MIGFFQLFQEAEEEHEHMAHGVGNIGMSCAYALTIYSRSRVCHLDIFRAVLLFCFHPSLLAFSLGISHTFVYEILAATLSVKS
jgi:hypothetical protein